MSSTGGIVQEILQTFPSVLEKVKRDNLRVVSAVGILEFDPRTMEKERGGGFEFWKRAFVLVSSRFLSITFRTFPQIEEMDLRRMKSRPGRMTQISLV